MDEDDKARIRENFLELADGLKSAIQEVCTYLMSKYIISGRMKERILEDKTIGLDRDRASKLLELIPTRGRYAYNVLYEAALEFELFDVANILKPDNAPHENLNGPNLPLDATDPSTTMEQPLPEHNQPSDPLPTQHSSRIKFDEDISLYKELLPYELKLDFIHVLIINAPGDSEEALKFKSGLENHDAKYSSLGYRKLNVKLLDELWVDPLKHLGFAFKRSFCILLFVTAEFVNDEWPLLKGYACKKKHQRSKKKNNEVLPVHTALEKDRDYELPLEMECDEKPALIYCEGRKGECCKNVGILLGEYKAKILEKERQLDEQRKDFIVKNRDNLEKNLLYFQSLSRSYSETALKEVDSQPSTRSPTLPPREQSCPDFGCNFLGGGNQPNMSVSAAHVVRPETLVATPKPGARNVEMCQTAMVMSAQTPSDEPGLEVSIQSDSAYGGSEVTSDNSTDSSHVDEQRGFPEIPNSDNLISDISRVTIDEDSRSDDHNLTHE